jgi:very-short-patch-repair endonuclease
MSWDGLARRQHGVLSVAQLRDAGVARGSLTLMLERGDLVSVARGVYLVRGAPRTYEASLWIARLATEGVMAFGTACHLWGVLDDPPAPITVLVGLSRRVSPMPGVRIRRVASPAPGGERYGMPVTSREISLLDHLGTLPAHEGARLFDRALQRRWLTPVDVLRRLDTPRWGNGTLRVLAAVLGDGAASEFERRVHRLLRAGRIEGWVPNLPIVVGGRLIAVVDIGFEEHRLAIELDGQAFHVDAEAFQNDRSRQNTLISLGWRVLRFTWSDVVHRPDYVLAAITRQLARAA